VQFAKTFRKTPRNVFVTALVDRLFNSLMWKNADGFGAGPKLSPLMAFDRKWLRQFFDSRR
jgi:hypothetical protein